MSSDSEFESSNEDYECLPKTRVLTQDISILRYLPQARQILEGHSIDLNIVGNCLYENKLISLPEYIYPLNTQEPPKNVFNNNIDQNCSKTCKIWGRLNSIQETLNDHKATKQRIQSLLIGNTNKKQFIGTLWSLYGHRTPSYARFGHTAKKNNFANVLMNLNGIALSQKLRVKTLGNEKVGNLLANKNEFPDTIRFESHFEGGNLLFAYRNLTEECQAYDLVLQNDTNTKGHNQWFHFRVINLKKNNRIKFNIINFTKSSSLFSYGIKPLAFSERAYNCQRVNWQRAGEKINYYSNRIKRQSIFKTYYTATFQYTFKQKDCVYFAPIFPYHYTQLLKYLRNLSSEYMFRNFIKSDEISQVNQKNKINSKDFSIKVLAQSVGKNKIHMITISFGEKSISDDDIKIVWIFGRQHPAQTTSSYMVEGIINYLLQLYHESTLYGPIIKKTIFKIVPMMNVDGVIHGNTRAQITGVDPNRMWKRPLKRLCPEITALKKAINENRSKVSLVLDLHSHSRKLGCFFYGNSLIHDSKSAKIYPALVASLDERFCMKNCRFRGGYQTTARSVIFSELEIPYVYTVQCSLIGYLKNNRIAEFKVGDYYEMGKSLIQGYFEMQIMKMTKKEEQIQEKLGKTIDEPQDIDSARSQSSLSEDQYEQIKNKCNKNNHLKVRKCLAHQNSCNIEKHMLRNHQRMHTITEKTWEQYSVLDVGKITKKRDFSKPSIAVRKNTRVAVAPLNQISNNRYRLKQLALPCKKSPLKIPKIHPRSSFQKIIEKEGEKQELKGKAEMKNKQIQVKISYRENQQQNKPKYLCVVGNSLEDEHVIAFKNEVCTQVKPQFLKQALPQNKKNKNSAKMPKIMSYLCSNLIGVTKEDSVFAINRKNLGRRL